MCIAMIRRFNRFYLKIRIQLKCGVRQKLGTLILLTSLSFLLFRNRRELYHRD